MKMHGLILAGGHSTRMGANKADLVHPDGRTLARRTHDMLTEAGCEEILLSLRHDQSTPRGMPDATIIRDPENASDGPLVGILAAMRLHPDADWLVLACDLPRLDARTLTHLIASRRPGEQLLAYRSEFDGLPEPLCAIYAATSLSLFESAHKDGRRCPRKILIINDCRLLDPVTPRALDNANTPEDWLSATRP